VQSKKTWFITIWEGLGDIDRWISKNLDASVKVPHPSITERKIDYPSMDHYQQAGKRADKEMNNSK
jgi:hypothetical protein